MATVVQAEDNWCTAAVAEMILTYHGFTATQADFANAIPILSTDPGAENDDQIRAYKAVTSNGVVPELDTPMTGLTFQEVVDEINADQPLKNAMPGHARVARGYLTFKYGHAGEWIALIDPAEPNGYRWHQEWAGSGTEDHIYIRLAP